jgi:chemotaxis protein methyltransferase CheR
MEHLAALEDLLAELTGVQLARGGLRSSLASFVQRRTAELALPSMAQYLAEVASPGSEERRRLLDVISVPHTWFFRDSHQLEIVVELLKKKAKNGRAVRIWVPACATGEDAYSLAFCCSESGISAQIVGSDMSPRSLAAARKGRYGAFSLREFPERFKSMLVADGKLYRVPEVIRRRVDFVEHNLMDAPITTPEGWDLILCRNVLIYFDHATAISCAKRLALSLADDGWIFFAAGELAFSPPRELAPILIRGRVGFVRSSHQASFSEVRQHALPPPPLPASQLSHPVAIRESALEQDVEKFDAISELRSKNPRDSLAPQEFQRLVKSGPVEASGDKLFGGSDFIEAAEDVLRLAAESPLDPDLRMLSGIALFTAGDFSGGLRESRAALLLNAELWPAALYQGLCLERLGEHTQARGDFVYAAKLLESPGARNLPLPPSLQGLAGDLLEMVRLKAR